MHRGRPVTAEEARAVNAQARRLHDRLEAWLKEQK
jgi:hypothetical protein